MHVCGRDQGWWVPCLSLSALLLEIGFHWPWILLTKDWPPNLQILLSLSLHWNDRHMLSQLFMVLRIWNQSLCCTSDSPGLYHYTSYRKIVLDLRLRLVNDFLIFSHWFYSCKIILIKVYQSWESNPRSLIYTFIYGYLFYSIFWYTGKKKTVTGSWVRPKADMNRSKPLARK